ncbi:MAG: peptidase U32 family protein [Candidatus Woesearchaeota archaeon]
MKILSPAGSYKSAISAINAGADAIYLGLKDIKHQRSRCINFSNDELKKLMPIAKKENVEINITLNSSYNEDSFKDMYSRIDFLKKINVDSLIISDIGLIKLIKEKYPTMKISYSVQGQCSNKYFSEILKDLEVEKVIFDRNLSIKEVAKIKKEVNVEVEMFAFGYQCYSQDSICYMGDYFMGEPCNVQCAQRVKFPNLKELNKNKRYFFMKFQSALNYIPKLIESNIDYIKIEGRQRSSDYVYHVTKVFREAVDSYKRNKGDYKIKKEWIKTLKRCAYDFEVTNSFYELNEYHRKIITHTTLKNKILYLKDILTTFFETKNFTKLRKEIYCSIEIELNKSYDKIKNKIIKGLK